MNIQHDVFDKLFDDSNLASIPALKPGTNFIFFLKNYLSNFYRCSFIENGITFSNTEQYFMYQKALFFKDVATANKILSTNNPFDAKAYGREVKNYNDEQWASVRYKIMYNANWLKYTQNKNLADKLLATGNLVLVECNPVDRIWGIGLTVDAAKETTPENWNGKNLLGLVLMEVRTNLLGNGHV